MAGTSALVRRMALQDLVRFLLPKEDSFYGMLEELGALGHEAALALSKFGIATQAETRAQVQAIEHKADVVVRQMEDALARTFVTPIDREDLHRLTGELDDIVDLTNLTARALDLYHIEKPTEAMSKLMEQLVQCTAVVRDAVKRLRGHEYEKLIEDARTMRQLEKNADAIYRADISRLFSAQQIDVRDLLKQKEALDDLENAVDHCDNVADLLSNLAVKHG